MVRITEQAREKLVESLATAPTGQSHVRVQISGVG